MKRGILILISIIILTIIFLIANLWFMFGLSPTKAEVESFLEENSCNPYAIETDYEEEHYCVYYMRRQTTLLWGQIYNIPVWWIFPNPILYIHTPFKYFSDFDPISKEFHTYTYVKTRDEGILVYNAVNGKYIKKVEDIQKHREKHLQDMEDLLQDLKNKQE